MLNQQTVMVCFCSSVLKCVSVSVSQHLRAHASDSATVFLDHGAPRQLSLLHADTFSDNRSKRLLSQKKEKPRSVVFNQIESSLISATTKRARVTHLFFMN